MWHSQGIELTTREDINTAALMLILLLLAGCATQPTMAPAPIADNLVQDADMARQGWWYLRFRLDWPEGAQPAWHRDVLIADQVIRPILADNREAISLWRFHRRAVRDAAGHQFSFIFRSPASTAAKVYKQVGASPIAARLKRRGTLESIGYDDLRQLQRPDITDTSDQAWSRHMQAAWPAFIMGVSQLWLNLIEQIGRDGDWPRGLDARYRAIDASLNAIWRREGSHALLHHLNALFAYRPVIVTTRAPMRF
ncbi:MAG: hypothetical protein N838_05280 [Thiohalocapsa sp. PB-PSB1]|nr:MAG: hypothetical protein N838_05280 [Thiohalocapsa sp. PB-PSB1]